MSGCDSQYRSSLRTFLRAEVSPNAERWEMDRVFPREVIRRLGEQGFFAQTVHLPAVGEKAGAFLNVRRFGALMEEMAVTGCFGLTLSVAMHLGIFLPMVARLAVDGVREELLRRGLNGQLLGAIAVTDDGAAGSDFLGMETTAIFQADQITVSGRKTYVTNGTVSDYVVVFARSRPGRHFANFSALLIPTGLTGVHSHPQPMDVMRTAAIGAINFDRVVVPASSLLGRKGLGLPYFLEHIAIERLTAGIWGSAAALACLAETQRYCVSRHVGTETLWSRSAVRHQVALAVTRVSMLKALVDQAVTHTAVTGETDPLQAATIKAAVAPIMESVVGLCLQLRGAHGLEAGSPLLRMFNDFRAFGVAGGSTETMLDVVADLWSGQVASRRSTDD